MGTPGQQAARLPRVVARPFKEGHAADGASVLPPICAAADVRLITLIEAHGEAQDVAAETLAQAFFTVIEARKACNAGQVEAAMKLYESIPLREVMPRTQ